MTQVVTETNSKLELETSCGLSFKAWTDSAREAGLVLRMPHPDSLGDSGDYPQDIFSQLRNFRRVISRGKVGKKVITHIHRTLVNERDSKGKPIKREYLWYNGYYEVLDHRGAPYHANLEVGRFERPKIVVNSGRKFDPNTGLGIGPEKIFSGSEVVYTIPVPQSKTERKRLLDEIIGDNFPEEIHYYYDSETTEPLGRSDDTFTYDEFVNDTIEELRKKSFSSSGGKSPGIWRDNDGNLRDKFGQKLSLASGKEAYQ